jgi:hypothetical protein
MIVGFTGTRNGLTEAQRTALNAVLTVLVDLCGPQANQVVHSANTWRVVSGFLEHRRPACVFHRQDACATGKGSNPTRICEMDH